jgi:hypothetical protein
MSSANQTAQWRFPFQVARGVQDVLPLPRGFLPFIENEPFGQVVFVGMNQRKEALKHVAKKSGHAVSYSLLEKVKLN